MTTTLDPIRPPLVAPPMRAASAATTAPIPARASFHAGSLSAHLWRSTVRSRLDRVASGRITVVDGVTTTHGTGADPDRLHAAVQVHDPGFYAAAALGGTIGAGEAYVDGWWSCDDLVALIRILAREAAGAAIDRGWSRLSAPWRWLRHRLRPNTRRGARANIAAHYDLSNDFYALWLDETMSYSALEFGADHSAGTDSDFDDAMLAAAARRKLDRIGDRLALRPHHHLVEIGTGWGGLAIHLARRHGCRVTTTTISRAQQVEAEARVRAAGLGDRITVLGLDYRDLPRVLGRGCADRLVSVEMVEAIGHAQYPRFFQVIGELLRHDGAALVQTITVPERRYAAARAEVDFIKAHVFPGCNIPAQGALLAAMRRSCDLDPVDCVDLTADYARTLSAWRQRFLARWAQAERLGFDQRFRRLWEFYLAYCEAGFRERTIGDVQLTFARPGWRG